VSTAQMHAWEKALNAAKGVAAGDVVVVGFQHTTLPKNVFHYFHDPGETTSAGAPSDLPLPDLLACNGDIPLGLMEKQRYPNLVKVEAVRQLYLSGRLGGARKEADLEPALLVAGSIDRDETRALVGLAATALDGAPPRFKVWLKGHPALPMEEVCASLGLDPGRLGFEIKDGPVDGLIEGATAVMAGASTVALEALALAREIIVPVLSDQMFMSPLAGFESLYHRVYSPEDLARALRNIFDARHRRNLNPEWFITRYWNLDPSLKGWGRVLGF